MIAPHPAPDQVTRRSPGRSHRVRTGLAAVASLALVTGLALAGPAVPAATQPVVDDHPPAAPTVEAQLHHQLAADGEADFWVYLRDEPQLSQASGIADRAAQGRYVHDQLTDTAARSQEGLLSLLEAADVDYEASGSPTRSGSPVTGSCWSRS